MSHALRELTRMNPNALDVERATSAVATPRLAWLDGLRAIAALAVCFFHISPQILGSSMNDAVLQHFSSGRYGVLLFFLVSGYIIPMSLERHGSLRRFWIGRMFRMYPAYLISIAAMACLVAAGLRQWPEAITSAPMTAILGHASMMSEMVGIPGALVVHWTLGYELVFYLITAGFFVYGLHRRSAIWAAGLAVLALIGGAALPDGQYPFSGYGRLIAAGVLLAALVASCTAYVCGNGRARQIAAITGIATVSLAFLHGNAWHALDAKPSWESILVLAVMFTGTVLYRANSRQISRRVAVSSCTVVLACLLIAPSLYLYERGSFLDGILAAPMTEWAGSTAAVIVTFGFAYILRNRRTPRILQWIGTISYSMYLFHIFVMYGIKHVGGDMSARPMEQRMIIVVVYCTAILFTSWASYRLVELPGQRAGHRVLRYLERRWPVPSQGTTPTPLQETVVPAADPVTQLIPERASSDVPGQLRRRRSERSAGLRRRE
jgi:peptidoglycan/LPS O-acetylase OafA/YrhL